MAEADFSTKHEQLIAYMEKLEVGARVSVRKIAQAMDVSEGTAYRAIKDAEARGIVSTKLRTGTVRVDSSKREKIDRLTFGEIVAIVDGQVLGGEAGLGKPLSKFVIGAMQLEAMMGYIEPDNLLIVGNREKAHLSALARSRGARDGRLRRDAGSRRARRPAGAADPEQRVRYVHGRRAHQPRDLRPADQKQIVLVADIMNADEPVASLPEEATVADAMAVIEQTNHNRFPVVDRERRPVGMVTTKDLIGASPAEPIAERMTPQPKTCTPQTSVATAGHRMVAESIELLPVVDAEGRLSGVISRKDVLQAMQQIQHQPQNGETLEDQIRRRFVSGQEADGRLYYEGPAEALFSSPMGHLSEGVLAGLVHHAAARALRDHRRGNLIADSQSVYYLAPVEIDQTLRLYPELIELSRKFCKIEIQVYADGRKVAQSMLTARLMEP